MRGVEQLAPLIAWPAGDVAIVATERWVRLRGGIDLRFAVSRELIDELRVFLESRAENAWLPFPAAKPVCRLQREHLQAAVTALGSTLEYNIDYLPLWDLQRWLALRHGAVPVTLPTGTTYVFNYVVQNDTRLTLYLTQRDRSRQIEMPISSARRLTPFLAALIGRLDQQVMHFDAGDLQFSSGQLTSGAYRLSFGNQDPFDMTRSHLYDLVRHLAHHFRL